MPEDQFLDNKSIKMMLGKTPDWGELAKDCVGFANSRGGTIQPGKKPERENVPGRLSTPIRLTKKPV